MSEENELKTPAGLEPSSPVKPVVEPVVAEPVVAEPVVAEAVVAEAVVAEAVVAEAVVAEAVVAGQLSAELPWTAPSPPVLPWVPVLPPSPPQIWLAFLVVIGGWLTASTLSGILLLVCIMSELGPMALVTPPKSNDASASNKVPIVDGKTSSESSNRPAMKLRPPSFEESMAHSNKVIANYASTATGLLVVALTPQFLFALSAIIPAWFSSEGWRQRLRLRRGRGSLLAWIPLTLAAPGVGFVSSWLGAMVFTKPSAHLDMMSQIFKGAQGYAFFLLVFLIGVMPGIAEELLFRGYLQSRLEKRWRPWLAILVSSVLFALAHFDPMHVLLVIPLGIWFGVISRHTDSLIPPMLAHMVNNVLAVIMTRRWFALHQSELTSTTLSEDLGDPLTLVVVVISLSSLLISLVLLARKPSLEVSATPAVL